MSTMLTPDELLDLLAEYSADEIKRDHADRLDHEGLALLDDFNRVNDALDGLSEVVGDQLPPAPQVHQPVSIAGPTKRKRSPMMINTLRVAACLLIFVTGWLARSLIETTPETPIPDVVRGGPSTADREPFDRAIAKPLLARGVHHFERADDAGYRAALADFKAALALDPDNARTLEYLVMTCEVLGLERDMNDYHARLTALEQKGNLP